MPVWGGVSRIMSYAAPAGFFTQKHPFWHCPPPSSHYTLIPLFFSIFIILPLIPGPSTRFWKMPESSQHQSSHDSVAWVT